MSELKDRIRDWSELMAELQISSWEEIPGIPLYMDQVVTLLNGQLESFKRDAGDKQLTSTMINNYVKSEVIPHPAHKKYSREQVAAITVVGLLKSVLSMQDLKTLLSDCPDMQDFYRSFQKNQQDALAEASGQVRFALENGDNLKLLALRLSAEAMAKRAAAERILLEIAEDAKQKPQKGKNKG